jgi:CBS domain-containing protein
MLVRDIMTANTHHCYHDQLASDAARMMEEFDVGCIPVVDDARRPIGMLTDRDICLATYDKQVSPFALAVSAVMSTKVLSCRVSDTVANAERTMQLGQVRRLPVIDREGTLVGILSLNDIVLARSRTSVARAKERLRGQVAATFAAICRHRSPPVGIQC